MSIIRALSKAADNARMYGRPDPVITTDGGTAQALADCIARELGDQVMTFGPVQMPAGVVAVYDGIQIRAAAKPRVRVKMGRRVEIVEHVVRAKPRCWLCRSRGMENYCGSYQCPGRRGAS